MKKELIEKIKSKGYWRINFQPLVDVQKLKSLGDCKDLVEKNTVKLRGWDYPHFPRQISQLEPADNYYLGWVDWMAHKEFWHMYQSGQFLHYLALREDWFQEDTWWQDLAKGIKPMTSLGITGGTTYQLTEVFEFLSRLATAGIYEEGVLVNITLNNTKDRELWIEDQMRAPFLQIYKTAATKIEIERKYSKDQVISSPKELAMDCILHIFDRFGWHNPPISTLKKDQDNLLTGKL